jgi:hypothetical protein
MLTLLLLNFSGPINPNPVTDCEKFINQLQIKYQTYIVEFDITAVSLYSSA